MFGRVAISLGKGPHSSFIMIYGSIFLSLPHSVVDASTFSAFKARLDTFCQHPAFEFDFTADLTRAGNRSEEVVK